MSELNLTGFYGENAIAESTEKEEIGKEDEEANEPDILEDETDAKSKDGEKTEDDSEDEPEDVVDDVEQKLRDFQSKADKIDYQNKLLLQQNKDLQQKLMQNNNQTDIEEDVFAGIDDDEIITVGQQRESIRKEAQRKKEERQIAEAQQADIDGQRYWMTSQPDFKEVDAFYVKNKDAIDQALQIEGAIGIRETYRAIRSMKKDSDLDALISKNNSLKKENKKLIKKKRRVPGTGPGGGSGNPGKGSGSLDMGDFFQREWNR